MAQINQISFALALLQAATVAAAASVEPPDTTTTRFEALQQRLAEQSRQIDALRGSLAAHEAVLADIRAAVAAELRGDLARAETGSIAAPASPGSGPARDSSSPPPASERRSSPPAVAAVSDQAGVLTPRGKAVFEPSLQYSYSSSNRIALVGYTVIPAVLVGLIDVREVKRTTFTGAVAARFGASNRLELEVKLPYVYRSDVSVGREFLQGASSDNAVFDAGGRGIGDFEATARYQFNDGGADRAYYVGSLRVKSRTGKDPFQIQTSRQMAGFSGDGLQTELPTGSGFYGLQPALTMLYPSDPAVFFGTISYLHSVKRNNVALNTDEGPSPIGAIAPGGILGFNFGMGLAINEKSSFSLGYDHSAIARTRVNGQVASDSVPLQLGTLLLGYAYRLDNRRALNVSLGAGLTRDTPDVTLTMRVPTSF